jgi:hypothetical protein
MSFIALTLLTLALPAAHALPLLSQNAAQNVASSLTLYPDHENPNLFHLCPRREQWPSHVRPHLLGPRRGSASQ